MDIPVPLESVSRVEVMRGSGSTLYGVGRRRAASSTSSPRRPQVTEFRLRTAFGSDGINQQRASLGIAGKKLSEQLSFSRDFSTGFQPDRDYRNLEFASVTRLATGFGTGTLNLAYMDHPFGADQFYGNFNSWEDTKTWFAGVQQALGAKTTASFAFRRHSDLFVLYRDRPDVFANHHSDESYQTRRAPPRGDVAPPPRSTTAWRGCTNPSISNNLGDHARSRAAAYAAADFRALKRFSLTVSAREELYRSFSGAFTPTVAGGVWLSPALKAARLRQPRLPRSQLHRPLLSRPRQPGQSRLCGPSAPGPTRAASTGCPARACAAS